MRIPSRLLCGALAGALFTQLTACGTLFYPERRGQIDGKIDPAIFVLDALGILFYVLPGLIALGVDFATGAIYLPDGTYSLAPQSLQDTLDADGQVNKAKLRALILEATGHDLPLDHPRLIESRGGPEQLAAYGLSPAA